MPGSPLTAVFDEPVHAYDGLQISHFVEPRPEQGFVVETWFNPPVAQALTMPGWFDDHFANMRRYNRLAAVGVGLREIVPRRPDLTQARHQRGAGGAPAVGAPGAAAVGHDQDIAGDVFIAPVAVGQQGHQVRLGAGRKKERAFLAKHLGGQGPSRRRRFLSGRKPDPTGIGVQGPPDCRSAEEEGKFPPLPVEDVGPEASTRKP